MCAVDTCCVGSGLLKPQLSQQVWQLLQHGARVDAYDSDRMCPLQLAAQRGHTTCVALLAAAQPDLSFQPPGSDTTALTLAHQSGHSDCVAVLQDESRWRRRRALALIREQREAGSDWKKARKEWRHSKVAKM